MARDIFRPTVETASTLALDGLAFLAEDADRLTRFLALTGIGTEHLRVRADGPETLVAVLDHLLSDESLLLVFATSKGIAPETIAPSREILARTLGAETPND
jgi:hypothetical protein